jgi:hypothetical protein
MDERSRVHRSAESILADWREAERRRDEYDTGSHSWIVADQRVDELRHEFHESVDEVASASAESPILEKLPA